MSFLSSLRGRMLAFVVATATAVCVAVCAVIAWKARASLAEEAYLTADTLANGIGDRVINEFETVFASARTFADFAASQKARDVRGDRAGFDAFLLRAVNGNAGWLGAYTLWEPNAFDGRDAEFRGAPCHDPSGRYVPYWVRSGGKVTCEANKDYDKPGIGDYYIVPMQTGRTALIDPYAYPVDGKELLIVSFVAPVIAGGKPVGIIARFALIDRLAKPFQREIFGRRPCMTMMNPAPLVVEIDTPLQEVGRRLQSLLRGEDVAARIGGDEFIVIVERGGNAELATTLAERILDRLRQTIAIDGEQVSIGVSIGIALCPQHARNAEALRRAADAAMYQVKRGGKNVYAFAAAIDPGRAAGSD